MDGDKFPRFDQFEAVGGRAAFVAETAQLADALISRLHRLIDVFRRDVEGVEPSKVQELEGRLAVAEHELGRAKDELNRSRQSASNAHREKEQVLRQHEQWAQDVDGLRRQMRTQEQHAEKVVADLIGQVRVLQEKLNRLKKPARKGAKKVAKKKAAKNVTSRRRKR